MKIINITSNCEYKAVSLRRGTQFKLEAMRSLSEVTITSMRMIQQAEWREKYLSRWISFGKNVEVERSGSIHKSTW